MTTKKNLKAVPGKDHPTIVWLRHDLRLADHPALLEAVSSGGAVLPVFIWAPQEESPWAPGAASRVWLHHSLKALEKSFAATGSRLLIFDAGRHPQGSAGVLHGLARLCGAGAVHWSRRYEPAVIKRDSQIKADLRQSGLTVKTFKSALLLEPWEVLTKQSKPYQVFTPYWQACRLAMQTELCPRSPLPAPVSLPQEEGLIKLLTADGGLPMVEIDDLALLPTIKWHKGIEESFTPGEAGANEQLGRFLLEGLQNYQQGRDQPARAAVSRLSAHLHFGEISPATVWHLVCETAENKGVNPKLKEAAQAFLRELGWREFSHHILYHFPHTSDSELRPAFSRFPWSKNESCFKAWSRGLTGYPIVDAGMRELWHTGLMHNRVRMIAASFLVKDLLLPWQEGARWFWDTLVDADLAQNSLGWQWTAGCGADAAPYFRIFNPTLQGEKFDPEGIYVKRWLPELAALPAKWIHKPWLAPPLLLASAGVTLGTTYPCPIVDHTSARNRALAAFQALKEEAASGGQWQFAE